MESTTITSVMEELRAATRTAHITLEKATLPYIKDATDKPGYARLLALFYGYFLPVEGLISRQQPVNLLPDYEQRRKSSALWADITSLQQENVTTFMAGNLPEINNPAQALGALYVLEGSTLGGQIITKMLLKQSDGTYASAMSFFNGYGSAGNEMWGHFCAAVSDFAAKNPESVPQIISAANETFECFYSWIKEQSTAIA